MEARELIEAIKWANERNTVSISSIKKAFGFGDNKASMIMDALEEIGLVRPYNGSKERSVRFTLRPVPKQVAENLEVKYETVTGE